MAESQTRPGEGAANVGSNIADMNAAAVKYKNGMVRVRQARRELNEEAGELREAARNSGLDTKVLDAAIRVLEMDEEGQNNHIDQLRVAFDALGIGSQGLLFPETATTGRAEAHDAGDGETAAHDAAA